MRLLLILLTAALITTLGFRSISHSKKNKYSNEGISAVYSPVVVLELFTSEGCSSCPRAEALLPKLAKLDSNIFPLSFHIDYWNKLGWDDPFSNPAYSARQRHYAARWKLESVYTPQLIINGEYDIVGSHEDDARATIKKELNKKAAVKITISNIKKEKGMLLFTCYTKGDIKYSDLLAALVQKTASTEVKAGENRGSRLTHMNVVRSFKKQPAADKLKFELDMPDNLADDNWQLIVYSQLSGYLTITGASLYDPFH